MRDLYLAALLAVGRERKQNNNKPAKIVINALFILSMQYFLNIHTTQCLFEFSSM